MFLKKVSLPAILCALTLVFTACSGDDHSKSGLEGSNGGAASAPSAVTEASSPVYFAFDSSALSSDAQAALTKLAEALKAHANVSVEVAGHTDELGPTEYNLALGNRRAQSVKDFLVSLGVEDARLSTISHGKELPAVPGHDEAAWSKNRRAEFAATVNK